jgi:ubiquinone/menaquinone biosynthesis C-methylase UbiE
VDRTLQHVPHPELAVREMVRVAASGGVVVAIEPDWETLLVDSTDQATTRIVAHTMCNAIPNGWIGRSLYRHFSAAGLVDLEIHPETFTTSDLATANNVFQLERILSDCLKQRLLSDGAASQWFSDLKERAEANEFFGSLTLYMVRGRKQ